MPAEQIRFTLVNVSIPSRSAALRISSVPAPAVWSPPVQIRRTSISGGCWSMTQQFNWILHRADRKSRTKITNNIRLLFKIKQSMLTPAQKSQNRDKHKLFCRSFGREDFVLLFLITQTYNCGREWLCDYRGKSIASWASCLPYCAAADSNCNQWGLPDGGAKPDRSRNAADRIQWKLGVSADEKPGSWFCTW